LGDIAAIVAVAMTVLRQVTHQNVLDLDLFHEAALFRAALARGGVPDVDLFAFTPTIVPSVHYEWGMGAIVYTVGETLGTMGLLLLRDLLIVFISVAVARCARSRGATWPLFCVSVPAAILLSAQAFVVIRAGLFTLTLVAVLLLLLEHDRAGGKWWVVPWLAVYVLWVNVHPGFIVGAGLLALHWGERVIRERKIHWHLIATGAAMAGLMFVNPYTWRLPIALAHDVTMARPNVVEWWPMWRQPEEAIAAAYVLSLLLLCYAILRIGWKNAVGLSLLVVMALAAAQHVRHGQIYALIWLAYVPAWLARTPLGALVSGLWSRRSTAMAITVACAVLAFATTAPIVAERPWQVRVPSSPDDPSVDGTGLVYPAGAVEYLRGQRFAGNLMTDFNAGSYVMWHLGPQVKVGLDSRYEAAYTDELVNQITILYAGLPGWREILDRYHADALLVRTSSPLCLLMEGTGWRRVYVDDAYASFARPGVELSSVDARGIRTTGHFP